MPPNVQQFQLVDNNGSTWLYVLTSSGHLYRVNENSSTSEWELVKHNFQQSSSVNSEDDFNI